MDQDVKCVRMDLGKRGYSTSMVGLSLDMRLISSERRCRLTLAVDTHFLTICWMESIGAKHRQLLESEVFFSTEFIELYYCTLIDCFLETSYFSY